VNHKVTKSVNRDSETDEKKIIDSAFNPEVKKNDTGHCKNDKKDVIALKDVSVFRLMMVGVEIPHETMHHVFMS